MEPIDNNLLYYFVVGVSLLIVATFVAYENTRLERRKIERLKNKNTQDSWSWETSELVRFVKPARMGKTPTLCIK